MIADRVLYRITIKTVGYGAVSVNVWKRMERCVGTYEGRRRSGKGVRTPTSVFVMFVVSEVSAGFWGVLHTVPAVRRMFLVTKDSKSNK